MNRREFGQKIMQSAAGLGALSIPFLGGCKGDDFKGLHIGFLTPKTGIQALAGRSCARGAAIADHMLDEMGLPVKITIMDTESRPDVGRLRCQQLLDRGVNLIVGAFDSAVSAVVANVCEQRETPFVINLSAAESITQQGYQFTFRNFQTAGMLLDNHFDLTRMLFETTGRHPKTAAVFAINDTFGQAMVAALQNYQKSMPFKIIDYILFDSKATDLGAEIMKLKGVNADIVMPITRGPDSILFVKACKKHGLVPPFGFVNPGSPGMYDQQFFDVLGKASNYMITNAAWYNPKSPLTQKAMKRFQEKYPGILFELNVAYSIEAIYIAAKAHEKAKSCNAYKLRDALRSIRIPERFVCGGDIQFDENGQGQNIKSASVMNVDGALKIILPQALAETDIVYPHPGFEVL